MREWRRDSAPTRDTRGRAGPAAVWRVRRAAPRSPPPAPAARLRESRGDEAGPSDSTPSSGFSEKSGRQRWEKSGTRESASLDSGGESRLDDDQSPFERRRLHRNSFSTTSDGRESDEAKMSFGEEGNDQWKCRREAGAVGRRWGGRTPSLTFSVALHLSSTNLGAAIDSRLRWSHAGRPDFGAYFSSQRHRHQYRAPQRLASAGSASWPQPDSSGQHKKEAPKARLRNAPLRHWHSQLSDKIAAATELLSTNRCLPFLSIQRSKSVSCYFICCAICCTIQKCKHFWIDRNAPIKTKTKTLISALHALFVYVVKQIFLFYFFKPLTGAKNKRLLIVFLCWKKA